MLEYCLTIPGIALYFLVNTCSQNFSTFLIVLSPVTFNSLVDVNSNQHFLYRDFPDQFDDGQNSPDIK